VLCGWFKKHARTTPRGGRLSNRLHRRWCCAAVTLHEWVKKHEVEAGVRDGVPLAERERIKALEREVKELRQANEILRLASAFFAQAELDRLKKK